MAFHPSNPDTVWTGHDGGLSLTEGISDSVVSWVDRDQGYITSQFYTVAIDDDTTDTLIGGGTQDNGSPFIEVDENFNQVASSVDASSGDGSYAHFADSMLFVSSQLGNVIRYDLSPSGTYEARAIVQPSGARNQLFIHPYMVDPNNKSVMYYPDASSSGTPRIWVNTEIDEVSNTNPGGTSQGWNAQELDLPNGFLISTLEVSRRPSNVLYYAASYAPSSNDEKPRMFRATDASGAFNVTEISIPDAISGAYIHDIALNPVDSDEAIAVMSNYGIIGIYHTSNAGENWTAIEGNLSDDESGSAGEGPSIRSATIMPTGTSTIYMVGTSVGLFSTQTLDGNSTTWMQESPDGLGNAVTEYVTSRVTDGTVAAGSHGRGIFMGNFLGEFSTPGPPATPSGLVATAGETSVDLSWTRNPEVDIAGYNVYKGTESNELSFLKEVSSTSATDENPDFETHYYAITAVDNDGNESGMTRPVASFRKYRAIDGNWRLVGSPLVSAEGVSIPDGATIYSYDGAYDLTETMEKGRGYWVKYSDDDSLEYVGGAATSRSVGLSRGWNMIAGVGDTISVDDIQDPDRVLSNTPVKEYANNAYSDAQLLAPTGGYFVHAQSEGEIILQVDTSSTQNKSVPKKRIAAVLTDKFDKLTFNKNGRTQSLFISRSALDKKEKQFFLRPPRAPQSGLDIRTARGYSVVDENREEINISVSSYPVTVLLESTGDAERTYRLVGVNKNEEVHFDLIPGKAVMINQPFDQLKLTGLEGDQIPLTNDLQPNYPNPFNPSTTIAYQLANQSEVKMEVYNLLGRKVQTLVDKKQEAGTYRVTFNGSSLSSGTYFVRIRAGEFQKVQKMTLIK
ncbi:MAG: T9SS type A sorting domain-containing protein [Balneolaceae bacterium]|nr:T9SS type A sorting domain-containing protein [Balneolaceae bacterium]